MRENIHSLKVATDTVIQDNFLGLGAIYHGYMFQADFAGRHPTPEQRGIELGRVERSRLKIARTYYDYNFTWYHGKWNWECPMMLGFYKWLEAMKERGVDIALNVSWSCPGGVDSSSGWPWQLSPFTVQGDWEASVNNYARWVCDSVYQMVEKRGFDHIKYLCMFTEPARGAKQTNPDGSVSWDKWLDCVKAAHEQLVNAGLRDKVKLVGPNEGSTATSPMVKWAAENADEYIDIYSSHNYEAKGLGIDNYEDWMAWAAAGMKNCAQAGKPFWFDEYGTFNEYIRHTSAWYGTLLGIAQAAFMNSGAQTSLLWTLFDQQWTDNHSNNSDSFYDGVHKHGLAPTLRESVMPRKSWYSFSMMSRFIGGEGTRVFKTEGTETVHIAACMQPDGSYSLLVVNGGEAAVKIFVSFGMDFDKTLYRRLYDPSTVRPDEHAAIPEIDGEYQAGMGFEDDLPAGAVAVYTTVRELAK